MTGKYDDRLKDYVDVKERIRLFYEAYPEGALMTSEVILSREPDDVPRVHVKALAYRSPIDLHPGVGWSWLVLPGSTPYTKGSEIENAETSAWGRAIGALGIGIAASIASADEVRSKQTVESKVERGDDGSLIGTVEVGDKATSDYVLRQDAQRGPTVAFRLRGERGGILVRAFGPLADQLAGHRESIVGQRVTVWGTVGDETIPAKGNVKAITYQVMTATRMRLPGIGDLPVDDGPEDPHEAESVAMFSPEEQAALDAAMGLAL